MTHVPDRQAGTEPLVNTIAAALTCAYLASGSLALTALTAAAVVVAVTSRRR